MKKYIVTFPDDSIPSLMIGKIKMMPYYELYKNVFFVRTDNTTSKSLYEQLINGTNSNEKVVIIDVTDCDYWGYASKDFWPWLQNKDTNQ